MAFASLIQSLQPNRLETDQPAKTIKDMPEVFRRNADACILHIDLEIVVFTAGLTSTLPPKCTSAFSS